MAIHTGCLIRVLFVLLVVFFSIYFLSSPLTNIDNESTLDKVYSPLDLLEASRRRQQELETALEETRIEITDKLNKFSFHSSIPGSNIKTSKDLLKFRSYMECVTTKGKWVYDDTPRAFLIHKQDPLYGKCDSDFTPLNKNSSIEEIWNNARNSIKYKWKTPNECPLPSFNRKDYCSLIAGKKILIVGDILSHQLHDLLIDYFHDGPVQCYGVRSCKDHILCPSPSDDDELSSVMRYARNDILSGKTAENLGRLEMKFLEQPWTLYVFRHNVIILNKGHHYQDDATFRSSFIQIVKHLRSKNPDTLLIFRSSTIGHSNCNVPNIKPLFNPYNDYELENLPYNWGEIHKQNMIAKEIIEAVGGVYWNIENVMETRVDDHVGGRDCLRWCIPGPSDIWLNLLFVLFKELLNQ
ncbi:11139_t:CDS:1 [Funneliformis caledonium]|uniref:11139_t:CDS:1 n=1 Tax=Funneliformis caledonium TaxID=1117310 RepID=A0A9N8YXG9_9GLOM|nr:11139_t:CDS:1 [Funneliformis caledonium]